MNDLKAGSKVLLVSATENEVAPFLQRMKAENTRFDMEVLITGVGMVATAFSMGQLLQRGRFSFAINAGIAGSFDKDYALGEIVLVEKDLFSELGAEDGSDFIPIDRLGFGDPVTAPMPLSENIPFALDSLRRVRGITVNTVHGNTASISSLSRRLLTQNLVETMEGAAFYYACEQQEIPSVQLRCISNYVEKRDRSTWKVPLAIERLNTFLIHHLIGT